MAARTKGFFDSDVKSKPKHGQWNRQNYNRPALSEAPTNVAPPKPPIPATAQAKSKLKAFQFTGETTSANARDGSGGLETDRGRLSGVQSAASSHHSRDTDSHTNNTPQLPHANTFPCTPGTRLPLEDLIGDCDKPTIIEPVYKSPEEQIGWIPNSSSDLLTPNRRRKRKRAKSSSPSCPDTGSQSGATTFLEKSGMSAMKTPAADPAADLWQRYANGKQSGDGLLKLPEISSLLFQGSPRPIETPVKGGGLRRWVSTGNDWPSSKNKKRCTNGRASINVWQDQTAVESGGKSKVATMVQRIQESLASQRLEQEKEQNTTPDVPIVEAPSSSSTASGLGVQNADVTAVESPSVQAQQPANRTSLPPRQSTIQPRVQEPRQKPYIPPMRMTQSGGVSAEQSGMMGDPLHPSSTRLHLQSKAPLPAFKRPTITRPPSLPKVPQVVAPPKPLPISVEVDEFDDAFDLTADDLDELLSQQPLHQRSLYEIPEYIGSIPVASKGDTTAGLDAQRTMIINNEDEFGDDGLDEDSFVQAEFSATQAMKRISPRKRSPKKYLSPRKYAKSPSQTRSQFVNNAPQLQRYVVKRDVEGEYTNDRGLRREEKILIADHEYTKKTTAITLRDSWAGTPISPGTIVHIAPLKTISTDLPSSSPPGQLTISDADSSPMLIVHPDHLLSATTIADSFDCVRKAVLQDRIKATSEGNKAMVYGKILHEIFQQALSANQWDKGFLANLVRTTVESNVEGLWELGMQDTNLAIEEVSAKMAELGAWAGVFVRPFPGPTALVDDRNGEKAQLSVSKLIAIEEHIHSPLYGLKGNIDATVQTTSVTGAHYVYPFEVKTGKTTQSAAHQAQTALYTLLLADRYDVPVEAGMLYYLESSTMGRIKPPIREIRQMVQQRNRVAGEIFSARHPAKPEDTDGNVGTEVRDIEDSGLPAVLKNPFKCGRCYAQEACFTFHALAENGTADSAGMIEYKRKDHSLIWKEAVGHLVGQAAEKDGKSGVLKTWFKKWERLLTFEEGDQARWRKELWTLESEEREGRGRCFGGMVLKQDLTEEEVGGVEGSGAGRINRYRYVLKRGKGWSGKGKKSFAEGSQITLGEPIVVSSEKGQWALANGYVVALTRDEVMVAVDRRLGRARERLSGFDEEHNQVFRGTMTVGGSGSEKSDSEEADELLYRLDKDEFSNGLANVRNNLVTLMSSDPLPTKLRDLMVFNTTPTFTPVVPTQTFQPTQLGEMNDDQRAAVSKVLSAQDYALILGMPGTGKTTTIAHIIRALLAEGKSILLTSFTHTAVDNILLKIRDIAPKDSILRLGVPAKINPQVQEFCRLASTPRKSMDEIEEAYILTRIVATTCMGTNHALFHRRKFDVCIVDEASQITLPTILGPLLHARKFVLVGDHYQLPPLVQNQHALKGGLDVSLFRLLTENHPNAVAALARQYRMCEDIMSLSNTLIYSGRLSCGNEHVAKHVLQIPNPDETLLSTSWLKRATHPDTRVLFANTDSLGSMAREVLSAPSSNLTNPLEAHLLLTLTTSLLSQGVPPTSIGIITLYRSQLALIRHIFSAAAIPSEVEVDSADRFQGRDKDVVIISWVRSNEKGEVGELLRDWRRVNVAVTRGRGKVVMVGSKGTLGKGNGGEVVRGLVETCWGKGWGVDLGREDVLGYGELDVVQAGLVEEEGKVRREVLAPSSSAANRTPGMSKIVKAKGGSKANSPVKNGGGKTPSKAHRNGLKSPIKRISGRASQNGAGGGSRAKKLKEQLAIEIFEDLTGDEF
ncbi:unnamed protein product [Zymoseptoria tritici ST99CH_1A5]|uniref:DNA replication ATP-dependent helicase/nuclease n=1 Tax=Zymoseptoria tritici ST99CH_1A5 TaxID=1276529 RepID=A0A1Y6L9X7_ZYMTR|nr:unnamed protein product [Zymoseptoria tritici ST99CH_1A5]